MRKPKKNALHFFCSILNTLQYIHIVLLIFGRLRVVYAVNICMSLCVMFFFIFVCLQFAVRFVCVCVCTCHLSRTKFLYFEHSTMCS